MKTTYNKPQVEIIELETINSIMTGSLRGDSLSNPDTTRDKGGDFGWDDWGK